MSIKVNPSSIHCTKNEVFHYGNMTLNLKLNVTFTEEIFNGKLHFFAQ